MQYIFCVVHKDQIILWKSDGVHLWEVGVTRKGEHSNIMAAIKLMVNRFISDTEQEQETALTEKKLHKLCKIVHNCNVQYEPSDS